MTIIQDQLHSKPHCPHCNTLLDGFTGWQGSRPSPGDLTVCAYCGETLAFTEGMGLRKIVESDLDKVDLIQFQQANKLYRAMQEARQKRGA